MIIDVDAKTYKSLFQMDPHPFISEKFIDLNSYKVERILRLVNDPNKPSLGLIVGVRNEILLSPFSAPFGGFHFNHELVYAGVVNEFIRDIKLFIEMNDIDGIQITLPPNIYHQTINSKIVNSLYYNEFQINSIDITNWVNLDLFKNNFKQKSAREFLNQAFRNDLTFQLVTEIDEKYKAYELINMNRMRFSRPIYMTFDDLVEIDKIWKTDYFIVYDKNHEALASAIFYRAHESIAFAVFWGDNEIGRPLRAMDFCAFNLWSYYKQSGYQYIDLGISTENGLTNEGLLRFKETHEAVSSLRYSFSWSPKVI